MRSPTIVAASLGRDWDALRQANAGRPVPPAWRLCLPDVPLSTDTWLDDLRDLALTRDDVAAALVRLAQTGDNLAGRVIVQAMAPRLARIARRDPNHDLAEYVGAAWLVMMGFPIDQRQGAVLVNLSLDALKRLSRDASRRRREYDTAWLSDPSAPAPSPTIRQLWPNDNRPDDVSAYIDALLELAARDGVGSAIAIDVLRSVYRDGLTGREAAARHGISAAMVRYYCSHTVRTLRAHRQLFLDVLGPC